MSIHPEARKCLEIIQGCSCRDEALLLLRIAGCYVWEFKSLYFARLAEGLITCLCLYQNQLIDYRTNSLSWRELRYHDIRNYLEKP